jgi:hypothetical protein
MIPVHELHVAKWTVGNCRRVRRLLNLCSQVLPRIIGFQICWIYVWNKTSGSKSVCPEMNYHLNKELDPGDAAQRNKNGRTVWWRLLGAAEVVVLYGRETWSLRLREERRLKVFENRVLTRIFGPQRDDITREWRKLPNLYSSTNIIRTIKSRRIRWEGHVASTETRESWWVSQKRPLGRPSRRWENSIEMDLREIRWSGVHWIYLTQDRDQWRALVSMVVNFRDPQDVGKLSSWATGGFSRRTQHNVAS